MERREKRLDNNKFRGCMVGGAIGDALGYPVEFMSYREIIDEYGEHGIVNYKLRSGVAQISDDTQMTMYTANSLLFAFTRMMVRGIGAPMYTYVARSYKEWYWTQFCKNIDELKEKMNDPYLFCWITNIPEMYASRAPGTTCLDEIKKDAKGTTERPINKSKGCGGVMRVAPVGLFGAAVGYSHNRVMNTAADIAATTHGHELGYIPAAALAYIVNQIIMRPEAELKEIIIDTVRNLAILYREKRHITEMTDLLNKAIELSEKCISDHEAVVSLGKGWVGEEALAIAVYCALKHKDSFADAVIAAVNHGGDSDSTGAICGNIIGAYLGFNAIPARFIGKLELLEQLLELSDDMALLPEADIDEFGACIELWNDKYIKNTYPKSERKY